MSKHPGYISLYYPVHSCFHMWGSQVSGIFAYYSTTALCISYSILTSLICSTPILAYNITELQYYYIIVYYINLLHYYIIVLLHYSILHYFGAWWVIDRFIAFHPNGRGFESRSSRYIGTLGKSFTRSCLWRFGVKLRHSIRAVSGATLNSSGLDKAL